MFVLLKGAVSTAECRCVHEEKGEEEPTQTVLRECRKYKEERGRESPFSEDLQTLLPVSYV